MGYPSVEACQESISSFEFAEWLAFSRINPFGEQRMDSRFAMLAALVANLWTDSRKRRWKAEDFMPNFEKALDDIDGNPPPVSVKDKVRSFFGMLVGASNQKKRTTEK